LSASAECSPRLVLGPLLRYVGAGDATIWVETDRACTVEVLGHSARTFHVAGHHYGLVCVDGLGAGAEVPYEVHLDGERHWPPAEDWHFPASVIRTLDHDTPLHAVFGSCQVCVPHEPPYALTKDQDDRGREVDALRALATRLLHDPDAALPDVLLLLGDQVYSDEIPPGTRALIDERRGGGDRRNGDAPTDQVADFEEYSSLYREAWGEPTMRWLLSTVSSSMIFDDHDVHDDWNISWEWIEQMRALPWWHERVTAAYMSYWIYQHLGNLSPAELAQERLLAEVRAADDAEELLRGFAREATEEIAGTRWSYRRDFGRTRLLVLDSRAGRVLADGRREMLSEEEWAWVRESMTGDFDHVLVATTLPWLLSHGLHHLEAWSEAICDGAWGRPAARLGERLRQALDLEHWPAFHDSFVRLADLVQDVATGKHGPAPASIIVLSGDVHHAYLAEARFPGQRPEHSRVVQAVCSPIRNPLDRNERRTLRLALSKPAGALARGLARAARVRPTSVTWDFVEKPTFDNQVAFLDLDGRHAHLRIEKTRPEDWQAPRLHESLSRRIA
jgi:hypothetical protein